MPPAPESDRIRSTTLRRLGLSVGAALVALVIGEVAMRALEPRPFAARRADYRFFSLDVGGTHVRVFEPGGVVRYAWDGDPLGTLPEGAQLSVDLNAAGLRGTLPPPDRPRVLFVGDSFTFGEGVADGHTFVERLGARPDAVGGVVNAGIPGYGTAEQALRLPAWLDGFAPRAVVLVFCPNDPIPLEDSLARGDRLMQSASEPLSGLRLLRLLTPRPRDLDSEAWYRSYYDGDRRIAWDRTLQHIRSMNDLATRRGAAFGVVLFPLMYDLDGPAFRDVHALVDHALRQNGIPVLDLLPAFRGQRAASLWVHPTDHHPNAAAHRIAADAMAPFVDELLGR